jgi:MFS family permease
MIENRKIILLIASTVIFIDMIGYGIVIPTLPIYAKRLGANEGEIGFLFSSYSIILLLTIIPFGIMVDRFGKRYLIISGMFTLFLSSLLYSISNSLELLLTARAIQGFSASLTWASALPLAAYVSSESNRGIEMSAIAIATGLGSILGPFIGGIGSMKTPFYVLAISSLLISISTFLFLKESKIEKGNPNIWKNLTGILKKKGIKISIIAISFIYFSFGIIEILFPIYMNELGYIRLKVGALFGILGGFFVVVQPLIGKWSDKRGRFEPIIIGLLLSALLFSIPIHFSSIIIWIILFSLIGISLASTFTPTLPLIADSIGIENQGLAYAIYSLAFSIGYMLGPWSGGVIAKNVNIKFPFYFSSFILLIGAMLIIIMKNRKETIC